jgi:UDP-glucose 4-epimerase
MTLVDGFTDKCVLITGGLGFIGSNLAIYLVGCGAQVTILDAMIPGHGGNLFNIEPVKNDVVINFSDIRDQNSMNYMVRGKDYIFHLAGQNDHVLSQTDPYPDIDINIKGSIVLLEACRRFNPEALLVYTGTRGEYGSVAQLPASEDAPINPRGVYELSSLTAQKVFKIYNDSHGIRSVTLRLTNIYGERAQMQHSRFGVANWFIRLALNDEPIQVFGDGKIVRDFVYVQVLNVGDDAPSSFLELARTIVEEAGTGSWKLAPFTPERAVLEPGDFYSDVSKIRRLAGWRPTTPLREGIRRTIAYYRTNRAHYW